MRAAKAPRVPRASLQHRGGQRHHPLGLAQIRRVLRGADEGLLAVRHEGQGTVEVAGAEVELTQIVMSDSAFGQRLREQGRREPA